MYRQPFEVQAGDACSSCKEGVECPKCGLPGITVAHARARVSDTRIRLEQQQEGAGLVVAVCIVLGILGLLPSVFSAPLEARVVSGALSFAFTLRAALEARRGKLRTAVYRELAFRDADLERVTDETKEVLVRGAMRSVWKANRLLGIEP